MTDAIFQLFREEISDLGGCVTDVVQDERRLFARSTLPWQEDVVAGDAVRSGVAMRHSRGETEIQPYVFREVCRNGQILAHADRGRRIPNQAESVEIRLAIRAAASPLVFDEFVAAMRDARHRRPQYDMLVTLLAMMPELEGAREALDLVEMLDEFSLYDLGNAVTSFARDTADQELRWKREIIGASVFARLLKPVRSRDLNPRA